MATEPLLSRADVDQLERLSLESLWAISAGMVGQRQGPGRGVGIEFADYRPYRPGDDLRRIDRHVFARIQELLIKTAPRESRIWLSVLVDASRSMDHGEPNKLWYARRMAALLGTVALLSADAVQVQLLSDGGAVAGGQLDAPGLLALLATELAELPAGRGTQLGASVEQAQLHGIRHDVSVLISDCLVPADDLAAALRQLGRAGATATLVHVMDPAEASPALSGSVELQDAETGQRLAATVTDLLEDRYATNYQEFVERTQAICRDARVGYVPASTSVDPLELLLAQAGRGVLAAQRAA
jgi:uncharacterized protein (DUF58 family)